MDATSLGRQVSLWVPPLLYMLVIFYLSSQQDPMPVVTEHVWDKALHLIEYGGLALLFCRAFSGTGLRWLMAAAVAIVATSAYGASDEWHQLFTPHRNADYQDWIADTLGGLVGACAYLALIALWRINRASRRLRQPRR